MSVTHVSEDYYFVYGSDGARVGQPFDGGYTYVHAPDYDTAFALWSAIHNPNNVYPPPYSELFTGYRLRKFGMNDEIFDDNYKPCHDTIIYQDRKE